jgi:hypothetical protein
MTVLVKLRLVVPPHRPTAAEQAKSAAQTALASPTTLITPTLRCVSPASTPAATIASPTRVLWIDPTAAQTGFARSRASCARRILPRLGALPLLSPSCVPTACAWLRAFCARLCILVRQTKNVAATQLVGPQACAPWPTLAQATRLTAAATGCVQWLEMPPLQRNIVLTSQLVAPRRCPCRVATVLASTPL